MGAELSFPGIDVRSSSGAYPVFEVFSTEVIEVRIVLRDFRIHPRLREHHPRRFGLDRY